MRKTEKTKRLLLNLGPLDHALLTYMVMGVGQRVIASLLGHADVSTTQRYAHVDAVSATQPLVEERWR